MAISPEQFNLGAFLPTTTPWDVTELQDIDVTSPAFKDLLRRLYQTLNSMALSVNIRDAGYYDRNEFVNGQLFFPNPALSSQTTRLPSFRQVFRKTINFGALPNNSTTSVAHGITITTAFTFTRIYATASDTTARTYKPIPFASSTAPISITVDATNVNIQTTANETNFDTTYVVLEYIKE